MSDHGDGLGEEFLKKDFSGHRAPREDFPIFSLPEHRDRAFIYFDSAATTQKPRQVIDRITHFYLHQYGTVHRAVYDLAAKATEYYEAVRERTRQFLNGQLREEIIFTSGTTDSINLVARSFGEAFLKEGDEVIISAAEHHANIIPWHMLVLDKKIILKIVPISDQGEFDLEAFQKLLSKKSKLVSVAYMTNTTGAIYPVQEIIEFRPQQRKRPLFIYSTPYFFSKSSNTRRLFRVWPRTYELWSSG